MAKFSIHHLEGMRYVDVHLDHETVRVEAGALCYYVGDIRVHSPLVPALRGMFKALLADEALYRPTYSGSGVITLESSLGGFDVLDLQGESWILEKGTYWASEESVDVRFHREKFFAGLWTGEGLVYLQTKVSGRGKVVVATRGPTETLTLEEGQSVVVEGPYVVGRTANVTLSLRRATRNFMGIFTSGEQMVRVYQGPGRVLLNPSPYWRYRMMSERAGQAMPPAESTL
jgi:uncharacterized protein (AIM24 family)